MGRGWIHENKYPGHYLKEILYCLPKTLPNKNETILINCKGFLVKENWCLFSHMFCPVLGIKKKKTYFRRTKSDPTSSPYMWA